MAAYSALVAGCHAGRLAGGAGADPCQEGGWLGRAACACTCGQRISESLISGSLPGPTWGFPGANTSCGTHVHRGLERRGPLEPQVSFRPPATRKLIRTETLPDDTADIRVVDHAAEGRLEGGQLDDKTRVVPQSQLDGLGDESTIQNGVKV